MGDFDDALAKYRDGKSPQEVDWEILIRRNREISDGRAKDFASTMNRHRIPTSSVFEMEISDWKEKRQGPLRRRIRYRVVSFTFLGKGWKISDPYVGHELTDMPGLVVMEDSTALAYYSVKNELSEDDEVVDRPEGEAVIVYKSSVGRPFLGDPAASSAYRALLKFAAASIRGI